MKDFDEEFAYKVCEYCGMYGVTVDTTNGKVARSQGVVRHELRPWTLHQWLREFALLFEVLSRKHSGHF